MEQEDKGKVPGDFPILKARVTLYSQYRKRQGLYYDAKEVWNWFRIKNSDVKEDSDIYRGVEGKANV